MEEKKKMERQDEKGRLAMAENNYGDNNKIEAQLTPLLGNSPAAKRTEFSTAPCFGEFPSHQNLPAMSTPLHGSAILFLSKCCEFVDKCC